MKKVGIILLLVVITIIACVFLFFSNLYNLKNAPDTQENISDVKDDIPLDVKIGQMIVIGYNNPESIMSSIYSDIENNKVSGLIFYKCDIKSPSEIKNKISYLISLNKKYPLFFVIDQEGGKVSRIADDNGFKTYPSAIKIAKKYSPDKAYKIYNKMASDLKNAGFNFNLAPCVDIIANKNSFISTRDRSYGTDSKTVYTYSREFIKAHNDNRIITALKHFPGIGSASLDSHKGLPDITNTWNKFELIPFQKIFSEYPNEPVMIGHIFNKKIDDENISSLSEKTINMLSDMRHNGIVVADAYDMDAVNKYDINEIIIKAINSGVNLFIFPNHSYIKDNYRLYMPPDVFINIVKNAVAEGKIAEDKINLSFNKITKLKKEYIKDEQND